MRHPPIAAPRRVSRLEFISPVLTLSGPAQLQRLRYGGIEGETAALPGHQW